jgi:hypothetical protein
LCETPPVRDVVERDLQTSVEKHVKMQVEEDRGSWWVCDWLLIGVDPVELKWSLALGVGGVTSPTFRTSRSSSVFPFDRG